MKPRKQITAGLRSHSLLEGNGPEDDGLRAILFMQATSIFVQASWGEGWEHVSVSIKSQKPRCPTWDEMCFVKDFFFKPSEWVIQYHPAEESYVNRHPYVLHLWRPINQDIPMPPTSFV